MSDRSMRQPPLVILAPHDGARSVLAELREAGWAVREGWQLPDAPWDVRRMRLVCTGRVETEEDVPAAVLAAARGAGVVVTAARPALVERVYEDLRRVGPVELPGEAAVHLARLDPEQRRLLELLSTGLSLGQAGAELGWSTRTISRRLTAARRALGVTTTAEAVALVSAGRRAPPGQGDPGAPA